MKDFRDLKVWEKAHELTLAVYRVTKTFPREEIYGLISQMRRSSASIAANIAEGCGRSGDRELGRFLHVALSSASELEYHLLPARDLKFLSDPDHARLNRQVTEVKRMLSGLVLKLTAES